MRPPLIELAPFHESGVVYEGEPEESDNWQYILETVGLGVGDCEDLEVQPFSVQRFGTTFGLIPIPPDDEDDDRDWSVVLHPGNDMAFFEPWEGDYDT